jgi:hypothetical protein
MGWRTAHLGILNSSSFSGGGIQLVINKKDMVHGTPVFSLLFPLCFSPLFLPTSLRVLLNSDAVFAFFV